MRRVEAGPNHVRITVTIPSEMVTRLGEIAWEMRDELGRPAAISWVVNYLLKEGIGRLEREGVERE